MRRGYAIQPMDLPAVTVAVPTRGRVHHGLRKGVAAVQDQARKRVAVVAAEAGAAVARRDADRAEEAQVVEVHHDRRPRRARSLEGARAEQRQRVVEVGDVGAQLADRVRHLVLVAAAAKQCERRAGPRDVARASLEQRVLDAGPLERGQLQLD